MEIKTTEQIIIKDYEIKPDINVMDKLEYEKYSKLSDRFMEEEWVAIDSLKEEIRSTFFSKGKDLTLGLATNLLTLLNDKTNGDD